MRNRVCHSNLRVGARMPTSASSGSPIQFARMWASALRCGSWEAAKIRGSCIGVINSECAPASWSAVTESAESPLCLAHCAARPQHQTRSNLQSGDCVSLRRRTPKPGGNMDRSCEASMISESGIGARNRKRQQAGRTPNASRSSGSLSMALQRLEYAELAPAFSAGSCNGSTP